MAHEMRLLPWLAARAPRRVVQPIAVEPIRGFMIQPDGGHTLASVVATMDDSLEAAHAWQVALVGYAELQQAAGEVPDAEQQLLALGLADLRPGPAADLFQHYATYELPRLRPFVTRVHEAADRLTVEARRTGIRATIQQDDLQPSNVLHDGRIIDFGDAHLAHPFASLLTALNGNSGRPGGQAAYRHNRDAYLASWSAHTGVDHTSLDEQATLAGLIAPVGRIRAWLNVPGPREAIEPALDDWCDRVEAMDWSIVEC